MRKVYLDNAATTPIEKEVLKEMEPYFSKIYGNPSSFNESGRRAKKAIEESRKKVALILGAKQKEIIFTSSATEANNLAIFGLVNYFKKIQKKIHLITTQIEHPSILEPMKKLEKEGIEITYLKANKGGIISIYDLEKSIKKETILISIIYANNEIGSIQEIKKFGKVIKKFKNLKLGAKFQPPYFHTDASQATNFLDINVNNLGVDLMTISSHKIYGPKGIAALYLKRNVSLEPLIYGGGQEFGLRSSTEAVPLIKGFAKALEITEKSKEKNKIIQENLREYFLENLKKLMPEIKINGPKDKKHCLPNIINITFPEIENEQLLLYLDKYGVSASSGSACLTKELKPSYVLKAVGLTEKDARSSIRFSLGRKTTKKDLDYTINVLKKVIKKLKKIYPQEIKKHYFKRI